MDSNSENVSRETTSFFGGLRSTKSTTNNGSIVYRADLPNGQTMWRLFVPSDLKHYIYNFSANDDLSEEYKNWMQSKLESGEILQKMENEWMKCFKPGQIFCDIGGGNFCDYTQGYIDLTLNPLFCLV